MFRPELAALDEVSALVVVLDHDGRILWWNRAYVEMTGFGRERLPVRHFTEMVAAADREVVEQAFHELTGKETSFEYPLATSAGETRWIAWTSRIMARDNGAVIISTGIDRTREHAAFEELRASEGRLRAVMCGSVDGILWFDEQRRITFFNQAAERMWGYRADEVVGRSLSVLIPEDQLRLADDILRAFVASDQSSLHVSSMDVRGRRKDGSEFDGDLVLVKVPWQGQWSFHVNMRDITERRRGEQHQQFFAEVGRLISSRHERNEILALSARLAVRFVADCCMIDLLGQDGIERLTCAHAAPEKAWLAEALANVHIDRTTPHPICVALSERRPYLCSDVGEGDLRRIAQSPHHLELLHALAPRSLIALPLFVRDELLGAMLLWSTRPRHYDEQTLPFAEELGRRMGLALENARLYRALEQAIRARDDVLGIVAHDLRSPLGAIQMAARALAVAGDGKERRSIEVIERASGRMSSLIDDLLDIARMEAGQLRLRRRRYDARELIEETVLGARPLADAAGVSVGLRCPERAVTLHADWLRCMQILTNLLSNALKFTPRGGHVEVRLEEERDHALICVRDTGPGIPREAQKHLFEPFWQRRRSTGEGAGLGLAIARGLVLAHGGEIGVQSEPGQGSTFWFRLPKGARKRARSSDEGRPHHG